MLMPRRPYTCSMSEGRTSALPRLSSAATSLCVPQPRMSALPRLTSGPTTVVQMPTMPAVYNTYPAMLPPAPDVPKRPVNPLRPPGIRRSHMTETGEPHLINEQRSDRMKQREHYRYHNAWSKYYYGSPPEQEAYRSYTRDVLKQQMADKMSADRQANVDKFRETEMAYNKDMQNRMDDAFEYSRRSTYLQSFRDENKRIMEFQWQDRRRGRLDENRIDREISKYNPINWSGTLK